MSPFERRHRRHLQSMISDLQDDAHCYVGHPASRLLYIQAMRHPGFRVLARWRLAACLQAYRVPGLPQALRQSLLYGYACDLSLKAHLDGGVRLPHPVGIVIGDNVRVGAGCTLMQSITLGGNGGKASGGQLTPQIQAGAFIGPGAVVLGPVVIGACARVKANSVVTQSSVADSMQRPSWDSRG
jgi:serine acetyltransferase